MAVLPMVNSSSIPNALAISVKMVKGSFDSWIGSIAAFIGVIAVPTESASISLRSRAVQTGSTMSDIHAEAVQAISWVTMVSGFFQALIILLRS